MAIAVKVLTGILLTTGLLATAQAAHRYDREDEDDVEYGRVIATSPILEDVVVPRQVCRADTVEVPAQRSGAGAVIGGIAGGVLGHTVGRGSGSAAATVFGAIAGAVIGDHVDNRDVGTETRQVERCQTVSERQEQVVAYRVTYEYAGKRYTTRMANDPGSRVAVQVNTRGDDYGRMEPVVYRNDRMPRGRPQPRDRY